MEGGRGFEVWDGRIFLLDSGSGGGGEARTWSGLREGYWQRGGYDFCIYNFYYSYITMRDLMRKTKVVFSLFFFRE